MSRCTVFVETESAAASELVLGCRPSLISWWIVWSRRQRGRSLNAPARPTVEILGPAPPGRNESVSESVFRVAADTSLLVIGRGGGAANSLRTKRAGSRRTAGSAIAPKRSHHADSLRPRVRREPAHGRGPRGGVAPADAGLAPGALAERASRDGCAAPLGVPADSPVRPLSSGLSGLSLQVDDSKPTPITSASAGSP